MKLDCGEPAEVQWPSVVGALVIAGLVLLIGLTAIGGWDWVKSFLESDAPAWIQAIGSVAAIVATAAIVQRQHNLELKRRSIAEQAMDQHRARIVRVVFLSAAKACETAAAKVGTDYCTWSVVSEGLREVRSRFLTINPMDVPRAGVLLILEECLRLLQICAVLVDQLEEHRDPEVQSAVRSALTNAAMECWHGFAEATRVDVRLDLGADNDDSLFDFQGLKKSRERLAALRTQFMADQSGEVRSEKCYTEK
jgi:hypothetical protein